MFFFLNLDLSYQRHENIYCADVVYPLGEKLSNLLIFYSFLLQSKVFLMYVM